jgi:hypothetical protein
MFSELGYKLRQQISKALQRRSEAIRNALSRYNTQAGALIPPRPQLTWKDIVEYSFLGEFDLLRQSRSDIRTLDWTKPAHREATVKYFKIQRAREEIERLNVEIRRLRTAIHDEGLMVNATIDVLLASNQPVGLELQRQWQTRAAINAVHLFRLDQIASQPNFSGTRGIGVRLNSIPTCESTSHGTSSPLLIISTSIYTLKCADIPAVIRASIDPAESETAALDILASEQGDGLIFEHEEEAQTVEDFAHFLASVTD